MLQTDIKIPVENVCKIKTQNGLTTVLGFLILFRNERFRDIDCSFHGLSFESKGEIHEA